MFDKDPALCERCRKQVNAVYPVKAMRLALEKRDKNPKLYAKWLYGLEHFGEWGDALRKLRKPLGSIPLRILVAGQHADNLANPWYIKDNYEIAKLSVDSQIIIIPRAGHGIHFDQPEAVIKIIEDVVNHVRAKRSEF